jgi:hypothetical protein
MPHDIAPDESHSTHRSSSPAPAAASTVLKRNGDAVAYQSTQVTSKGADRVLDDLSALEVSGARVSERGTTYLVFAPQARQTYTVSLAVTLTIILAIADLVATAAAVAWIALLPLALVPFVPLLLDDRPQVAVGAVPPDGDDGAGTRVTAHGRVWGDLGAALDAYLSNLPPGPAPAPAAGEGAEEADDEAATTAAGTRDQKG